MADPVYLDHNATTPLAPSVLDIIGTTLRDAWGNPSSSHPAGLRAKQVIDEARGHVAAMLGAEARQIVFTSGGTEANNWVIESALRRFPAPSAGSARPHVVTTNLEHDSVIKPLRQLQADGRIELTVVAASRASGAVVAADVAAAVQPNTCLVTVMLANNETGVVQPVRAVAQAVRAATAHFAHNVLIHTDAAQAVGKIPVDAGELQVDFLTVVGHKFYGPRIGALFARDAALLTPWLLGGGQERGLRSGTENTGMIAGLGEACRLVRQHLHAYADRMGQARALLEQLLQELPYTVSINGRFETSGRLPNTCNFSVHGPGFVGRTVLSRMRGVYASAGAACHSDAGVRPSQILLAIGVDERVAINAMRWSVGRDTTERDIRTAVGELRRTLEQIAAS